MRSRRAENGVRPVQVAVNLFETSEGMSAKRSLSTIDALLRDTDFNQFTFLEIIDPLRL